MSFALSKTLKVTFKLSVNFELNRMNVKQTLTHSGFLLNARLRTHSDFD